MPGRLYLTRPFGPLVAGLAEADPPEAPARANIQPGEPLTCLTSDGWVDMRWGLIPQGRKNARGRPVMETLINARSETVFDKSAFEGLRRCVVPVDGWYEWTGPARKKQAWALSQADGSACLFAGVYDVWQAPGGKSVAQVATVTCAPNSDVAKIHHRMGVLLRPDDVGHWLDGPEEIAATVMQPWPDGLLKIVKCADPGKA